MNLRIYIYLSAANFHVSDANLLIYIYIKLNYWLLKNSVFYFLPEKNL